MSPFFNAESCLVMFTFSAQPDGSVVVDGACLQDGQTQLFPLVARVVSPQEENPGIVIPFALGVHMTHRITEAVLRGVHLKGGSVCYRTGEIYTFEEPTEEPS